MARLTIRWLKISLFIIFMVPSIGFTSNPSEASNATLKLNIHAAPSAISQLNSTVSSACQASTITYFFHNTNISNSQSFALWCLLSPGAIAGVAGGTSALFRITKGISDIDPSGLTAVMNVSIMSSLNLSSNCTSPSSGIWTCPGASVSVIAELAALEYEPEILSIFAPPRLIDPWGANLNVNGAACTIWRASGSGALTGSKRLAAESITSSLTNPCITTLPPGYVECPIDGDGDGFNHATLTNVIMATACPPATPVDCDDNDKHQKPGQNWYLDGDNDGYPFAISATASCTKPPGNFKPFGTPVNYPSPGDKALVSNTIADCDDASNTTVCANFDPNIPFPIQGPDSVLPNNSGDICYGYVNPVMSFTVDSPPSSVDYNVQITDTGADCGGSIDPTEISASGSCWQVVTTPTTTFSLPDAEVCIEIYGSAWQCMKDNSLNPKIIHKPDGEAFHCIHNGTAVSAVFPNSTAGQNYCVNANRKESSSLPWTLDFSTTPAPTKSSPQKACIKVSKFSPFAVAFLNEELDSDGDGITDSQDNCPYNFNPSQGNSDGDSAGNACDAFPNNPAETRDTDGDGIGDHGDNCPAVNNPTQTNMDNDVRGDICDAFPANANEHSDSDGDGMGDSYEDFYSLNKFNPADADEDPDGDGTTNLQEFQNNTNPETADPAQTDVPLPLWMIFMLATVVSAIGTKYRNRRALN